MPGCCPGATHRWRAIPPAQAPQTPDAWRCPSAIFLEFRCARLYPSSHAKLVGAVLLTKLMFEIAFLSGNNGIADYEHRWDEHEDRPPAAKHQRECKVEERGRAVPRVTRKSVWPPCRKRLGGQSCWNWCSDLPECCELPANNY